MGRAKQSARLSGERVSVQGNREGGKARSRVGARTAREDVLGLADRLAAPMVLTLKAKAGCEGDNNPARERFDKWRTGQARLADPSHDRGVVCRIRSAPDNRAHDIRPEAPAAAVDRIAADDAVFTSDTGMATVWLSRFVEMRGERRLIGSYNLGSMANAVPQALGAQCLDRERRAVAFCGDGGLSMLLGDLMTLKTYRLPVELVVFDNRRLGMVKLEQEQAGLPEFGTVLDNPDFAAVAEAMGVTGIRVTDPADVESAVRRAFAVRARSCSTSSPTPTRSPCRPSRPSNRDGDSRWPR
jgi:thiamine pyrophosphate-dependent acetolactate synthase large subunit-like protein